MARFTLPSDPSQSALSQHVWQDYFENVVGDIAAIPYQNFHLTSAFQPIFCVARRQVIGYEALVRAHNSANENISPLDLFGQCANAQERVHLDRLCRSLHVSRFATSGVKTEWLFLNVTPATLQLDQRLIGSFFAKLLDRFCIDPSRIVVEILESAATDLKLLESRVNYYKDLGCMVALDDFGVDASDIRRIWQLSPDIVKLDRHLIAAAVTKRSAELAIRGLINMLHELGSIVLIEGIENEEQLCLAVDANTDLIQGYFLARPNETLPIDNMLAANTAANIDGAFAPSQHQQEAGKKVRKIVAMFEEAYKSFAAGADLSAACKTLLQEDTVAAIYLLDEKGKQLGHHIVGNGVAYCPLFGPCNNADGANWSRQPYFRVAVLNPGSIKVGRPYYSLVDTSRCVTLSVAVYKGETMFVLCCDLILQKVGDASGLHL